MTAEELFQPIDGRTFPDRESAEKAIRSIFAEHRAAFSPDYTPRQLLRWSYRKRWITPTEDGSGFKISVSNGHGEAALPTLSNQTHE